MSFDGPKLFDLLPAVLRVRDRAQALPTPGWLNPADRIAFAALKAKAATGASLTTSETERLAQLLAQLQEDGLAGPLASLLAVIGEQTALLQEDLDQLYDDQFIETCADWVVPYIGDLIGYRTLHGVVAKVASPRAEVAHTIAYRRRKGTVAMLEQLARDVTGWNASAVEFFQRLAMTQYMNHLRPGCLATPDLRQWERLEYFGTAFDTISHTVDVRRIASRRGRYNIPNVGLFLWRLKAYPLSGSPAVAVDERRWRFHPLGLDQPLWSRPQTEDEITQLATPLNVPTPIGRRVLHTHLTAYYGGADGAVKSLRLYVNSSASFEPIDRDAVRVCNLADDGSTWAHMPQAGEYAIDPALGRIALPPGLGAGTQVRVDFHYGFSADIGGGEYARPPSALATSEPAPLVVQVPTSTDPAITAFPTIEAALTALKGAGIVEITDSGRYEETLTINVNADSRIELRAANRRRPTLILSGDLALTGGTGSEVHLDGLLIAGKPLHIAEAGNALAKLHISHCTLVPGLALAPDGTPLVADGTPPSTVYPSLTAELAGLEITIEHSILGALRVHPSAGVTAADSIIDATATTKIAYAALDEIGAGAALTLKACTVIGKLHALKLPLVSNSILLASLEKDDGWTSPVVAARRQEGSVRFSYVPPTARVPRRYRCLPEAAASPEPALPRFTSLRYGFPAYCQLAVSAGAALLTGADDEGQPGAFHSLYQPQRETNLRVRLDEYLRVGLEAGIFYES